MPSAQRRSAQLGQTSRQHPDVTEREGARLTEFLVHEDVLSVQKMHAQTLTSQVDIVALEQTSYYNSERAKAVKFFVEVFDRGSFRDEWLVGVLALLDRIATAEQACSIRRAIGKTKGNLSVQWLAATLVILKQSSCEAELGRSLKEIILRAFCIPRGEFLPLWKQIVSEESNIYRVLDYRVASPTALDMALGIAFDVCKRARSGDGGAPVWTGLANGQMPSVDTVGSRLGPLVPRFVLLVSFLVELSMAHAPDAIYQDVAPPLALAIVCAKLALPAFPGEPAPTECLGAIFPVCETARGKPLLDPQLHAIISRLRLQIHSLWERPPADSAVLRKWRSRSADIGGPLPTAYAPPSREDATQQRLQLLAQVSGAGSRRRSTRRPLTSAQQGGPTPSATVCKTRHCKRSEQSKTKKKERDAAYQALRRKDPAFKMKEKHYKAKWDKAAWSRRNICQVPTNQSTHV